MSLWRVYGSGLEISGFGVQDLRVQDFGVQGLRVQDLQVWDFRLQDLRVQGLGFRCCPRLAVSLT